MNLSSAFSLGLPSFARRRLIPLLVAVVLLVPGLHAAEPASAGGFSIMIGDDDGADAEGLKTLIDHLEPLGDLMVAAPMKDSSAAGHSVTTSGPIEVEPVMHKGRQIGYAVDATPVTAMMIGLDSFAKVPPDLVVSGINKGFNIGQILYTSGTMGVAREAMMRGIPAIAVSLERGKDMDFGLAARFTAELIRHLRRQGFPKDYLININVPACKPEDLRGVMLTTLSDFRWRNIFYRRVNPHGKTYFWSKIRRPSTPPPPGSDWWALDQKMISVALVPLTAPSTRVPVVRQLEGFRFDGRPLTRP